VFDVAAGFCGMVVTVDPFLIDVEVTLWGSRALGYGGLQPVEQVTVSGEKDASAQAQHLLVGLVRNGGHACMCGTKRSSEVITPDFV